MRRWFGLGGVLSVAVLTLAACSGLSPAPFDVTAGFDPNALGFEVGEDDITIAGHNVIFASEPGSVGGLVTGYEIQYVDSAGMPLVAGSAGLSSEDGLAHPIPPGFSCASTTPCTVMATDVSLQRQLSEPLALAVTLPGQVALEFLETGAVTARAEGFFIAQTDNGAEREIPFELPITYPVAP